MILFLSFLILEVCFSSWNVNSLEIRLPLLTMAFFVPDYASCKARRMPSTNKYLWTQIKWLVEKQARKSVCEGKREGPQGNKLRVLCAHELYYGLLTWSLFLSSSAILCSKGSNKKCIYIVQCYIFQKFLL